MSDELSGKKPDGDDDPLRRGSSEPMTCKDEARSSFAFEGAAAMSLAFAGDYVNFLSDAGKRLGVTFTARDCIVKIASDDPEKVRQATALLEGISSLAEICGGTNDKADLDRLLSDAAAGKKSEIQSYYAERIKVGRNKRDIVPRTKNQLEYVRAMRKYGVVFGLGPAGTGKTYLAMAVAVSELLAKKCDRIILTRPAVEAGENLGFLPGKLEEKINPYLRPLYDALYDMLDFSEAEMLIGKGIIEVAPLAFMRGRTLNNAFIILDEAQNATNEQMLMFLTRQGRASRSIVCGDPSQTDLKKGAFSGLPRAVRILENVEGAAIRHLNSDDVVRHALVARIIRAYALDAETVQAEKE